MRQFLNFFLVRYNFQATVPESVATVVQHLSALIQPRKCFRLLPAGGYEGELSDSGFSIRRIATGSKGDTKPAVVIRGTFQPEDDQTVVYVALRHGRHLVVLSWLLLLIATAGGSALLIAVAEQTADAKGWAGMAMIAGIAVAWHLILCQDIRRVKSEIQALLGAATS